uniref:Uncharacterized protein n=1 Tax=Helianthus annuus TaxID=4232 RepID=A0A251UU13_HELAN
MIYYLAVNQGLGGFVACNSLSQRNDDPTKASHALGMWYGLNIHSFSLAGFPSSTIYVLGIGSTCRTIDRK